MRHTLDDIKKEFHATYYFDDKEDGIIDISLATCIASKLPNRDAIWLLIIGGPSSGKSEIVNMFNKVTFVHQISSLTENTFLSSMRLGSGKESSLLHRIGTSGMITQKDYTSILSMRPQTRDVIVGQMREIYDGSLVKEAGNGNSQKWVGKVNWIGAVTESVYLAEDESAGMGRRTINYVMPKQDRKKTTLRALQNNDDIGVKRDRLQTMVAEYVEDFLNEMPLDLPELPSDFAEELIDLSDFATLVRTPTARNYRGELILVPSPEMPMRAFGMMAQLVKVMMLMHDNKINDDLKRIITRVAFDSVPKQTRMILNLMTEYQSVTKKGCAHKLNYPTETVSKWLENVNVLGLCSRYSNGGADMWAMKKEYRDIMTKYLLIEQTDRTLDHKDGADDEDTPDWFNKPPTESKTADLFEGTDDQGLIKEQKEQAQRDWDNF